jgi:hypothetical protein
VIGFIAFNFLRGFIGSINLGSDNPTTAPALTGAAAGPTPAFTIDPNLTPGTVKFGEKAGTNCDVIDPGTSFAVGTPVWWSATLGVRLPPSASVFWRVTRDGARVASGTGPGDSPGGTWDVLCGNEPIAGDTAGAYIVTVLDGTKEVVLSVGQYTIGATGGSQAPPVGTVEFGVGRSSDCTPTDVATAFLVGTNVWWLAHLGVAQPKDATVVWTVTRNGSTVTGGKGPRDYPGDAWTRLCAISPVLSQGAATYAVSVFDSTGHVLLSTGSYTLGGG